MIEVVPEPSRLTSTISGYITLKDHAQALLDGVSTEVGRIGSPSSARHAPKIH